MIQLGLLLALLLGARPDVAVTATAGDGRVTLAWASGSVQGYVVKRATAKGGPYVVVGGTSTASYVDTSVQNGTTYYYRVTAVDESAEVSATPSGGPPPGLDAAQYVSQSVPANMEAGKKYEVSVTMRNTGGTTWTAAAKYNLGSQSPQDNTRWGFNRVSLPAPGSVAPGQTVTFVFTVTAPSAPGSYAFQWRVVHDLVAWFGEFTPPLAVPVASAGPPPVANGTAWRTLNANDARTGVAEGGAVPGALKRLWTVSTMAMTLAADSTGVYAATLYGLSPSAQKIGLDGQVAWSQTGSLDANTANQLYLAGDDYVLANDDGFFVRERGAGMQVGSYGYDTWGDMVSDGAGHVFAVNRQAADGPAWICWGMELATLKPLWFKFADFAGGRGSQVLPYALAYDRGGLFMVGLFGTSGWPERQGGYRLDPATGETVWHWVGAAYSPISAGGGRLFGWEQDGLVCRRQSDGARVWVVAHAPPNQYAHTTPPVLALGYCIVEEEYSRVVAYSQQTGMQVWSVGGLELPSAGVGPNIAAAGASDTLIVTTRKGILTLSLATGAERGRVYEEWMDAVQWDPRTGPTCPVIVGSRVYTGRGYWGIDCWQG